eukprot:CAMPEP_0204414896 /NCGR_PEP_ID=MMETSP0470-20130426/21976_1 /ASSEMBLY_ACC=CAM_ASM_000385 /TAXON_ID=2969 /ORGANISM="Oxyrrhis marina" /LENGTH=90 /DNA_ID=CAMNT_0051411203 /DNA_START=290 /DNA_END=559 /DNA_ORIENTATION=+
MALITAAMRMRTRISGSHSSGVWVVCNSNPSLKRVMAEKPQYYRPTSPIFPTAVLKDLWFRTADQHGLRCAVRPRSSQRRLPLRIALEPK